MKNICLPDAVLQATESGSLYVKENTDSDESRYAVDTDAISSSEWKSASELTSLDLFEARADTL